MSGDGRMEVEAVDARSYSTTRFSKHKNVLHSHAKAIVLKLASVDKVELAAWEHQRPSPQWDGTQGVLYGPERFLASRWALRPCLVANGGGGVRVSGGCEGTRRVGLEKKGAV